MSRRAFVLLFSLGMVVPLMFLGIAFFGSSEAKPVAWADEYEGWIGV